MSDQIELYLTKHVDRAADLYLLVSDFLECRAPQGRAGYLRAGSAEDELAVLLRLRRLLERIQRGSERYCLYSTPLKGRDTRPRRPPGSMPHEPTVSGASTGKPAALRNSKVSSSTASGGT